MKEKAEKIGIICAMQVEMQAVLSHMTAVSETTVRHKTFYCGRIGAHEVILTNCGVGKVCAAISTQMIIDLFDADVIINVGMGGGVAPGLHIGDVVIGEALIQHDFDLTAFGHAKGFLGREAGGDNTRPTVHRSDEKWVGKALGAIGDKAQCGLIVSGDVFIADNEQKRLLHEQFGAMVCEMEGAAVAQTAALSEIPFLVIRTISDLACEHAGMTSDELAPIAAKAAADYLTEMLTD